MTDPDKSLDVVATAAVTSVGLDAAQSCAAIRAGIRRFTAVEDPLLPDDEPRVGARISAAPGLRRSEDEWLINLGARALGACVGLEGTQGPTPAAMEFADQCALLLQIPESHRGHALSAQDDGAILRSLEERLGVGFSSASRVYRGGAADFAEALGEAQLILAGGRARRCIVGGVDSLLRRADFERLGAAGRLHCPGTPQGLVPGEAAAFVVVERSRPAPAGSGSGSGKARRSPTRVLAIGLGFERETVLEGGNSVGDAIVQAFEAALADAKVPEAKLDFVAGNYNGERYDAWESAHARTRCFRTRRDRMPTMWPAASTGEVGAAGGALALIAGVTAIDEAYAPGKLGALELRSEGPARSVVLFGRA